MRTDDVHPGDVIGGKYRVRAILSRTPTFVVEAFHVEFDQRVVIKLLLAGTGDDKEIERFRREARVLSKLESEHAARIIDVGTEIDGSFYLVRQHVEGEELGAYVQKYGPRPLPEAVLLTLQAAECVAETHANSIVVRELSPQNMVVSRRASGTPILKITDFGTAKLMRDAAAPAGQSSLTATALFGLSPYSSPELVRKAKSVDQRADVWSLGAVLYFMLAGKPPFRGDVTHLMLAITRDEPPPLTGLRGDLPPDLDNIMAWAMAKDIDRRFKHMRSFAHALAPYAPAEGQVLIERIAQIAHQAKQRKSGSIPAPPPSYVPPPPSRPGFAAPPASRPSPSVIPPKNPVAINEVDLEEVGGDDEATYVLGSNVSGLAREITAGMPAGRPPSPSPAIPNLSAPPPLSPRDFAGLPSRGLPVPPPPPSIPPSPFLGQGPKIVPPRTRQPSQPDAFPFGRFDTLPPPAVFQTARPQPPPPKKGFDTR
ncbi:MAG: serine/threonine protein kinase, partial [Myxococcales bacterium]|nr:serine/threonine protein kinase [Myxococcales bacterium]